MTAKQNFKNLLVADDMPLAPETARFIQHFVNSRDVRLAACRTGLLPEMGARLFKVPRVKAAIQKRINLIEKELARQAAGAAMLRTELLDASLVEEVRNKKGGQVRVRAIELGYRRTGLIRDGEFFTATNPNDQKATPSIYQSSRVLRRTVTEEVHETQTAAALTAPVPEEPPAPAANPAFKVLEY